MLSQLATSLARPSVIKSSSIRLNTAKRVFKPANSSTKFFVQKCVPLAFGGAMKMSRHRQSVVSSSSQYLNRFSLRHYAEEASKSEKQSVDQELRTHLKGFLMRVHPDFFSKHPKLQEENDRSLKQLNSLLDIMEDYSKKPSGPIQLDRNRVPAAFLATFWMRPGPKSLAETKREERKKEEGTKDPKSEDLMPKHPGHDFDAITASCTFPESYFSSPFPREMMERDVRIFLNELLKQAGLPLVDVKMAESAARYNENSEEISGQFDEQGKYKRADEDDPRRDAAALRKAFKDVIGAFMDRHYPDAQMAIDKLGEDWEMHIGHKYEASIALGVADLHHSSDRERNQLHYSPELNGEERAQALLLVEELWEAGTIPTDLPIYILKDRNLFLEPSAMPGFLTIPLDFDMNILQEYLQANLKNIMVTRYNMRGLLQESEQYIHQFTKAFKLARIDIRASLEHSYAALSAIAQVRSKLEEHYKGIFEGMTWHIVEAEALAEILKERPNAIYVHPDNLDSNKAYTKPKYEKSPSDATSFETEQVDDLPMMRRKMDLSPDHLQKMHEIRAKMAESNKDKLFNDEWDDEDEMSPNSETTTDQAAMDDIEADILNEWKKSMRKSKFGVNNESEAEASQEKANIEETDEFAEAMRKEQEDHSERIKKELVYTESTPLYSLSRDTLLIPWNTSSEDLLDFLDSHRAIWHFRQKVYPSKLWKRKMMLICKNLKFLLGVQNVQFSERTIWDKSMQLLALQNLQKYAPLVRNAGLKHARVIITYNSISFNLKKKVLKLPYNFNPKLWANFIKVLQAQHQLRQRLSKSRL